MYSSKTRQICLLHIIIRKGHSVYLIKLRIALKINQISIKLKRKLVLVLPNSI